MKRLLVLLALAASMLPTLALAHEQLPPGAIHVEPGEVREGDIATVDQPVVVDGIVRGDVTSISGMIMVRGLVTGDVVSWGGDILIDPPGQVEGNVLALAGVVQRHASAQVAGQVFNGNLGQAGLASVIPGVGRSEPSLGLRLSLALALLVLAVTIAALLRHIWPQEIASAGVVARTLLPRTLALGLLTSLLAMVALGVLLLLLTFSLVGMLAAPLLLLLAHLPFLAGLASAGAALEQWLGLTHTRGVVGCTLLLLPAAMLLLTNPLASLLAFHIAVATGVGALLLMRSAALRFHAS